ncbi:MAG: PAS domain S-box protein [Syntrophaceae bacterium]|nr:PAS domain S-box protein [Syntrophaceae bacterium]
MPQKKHVRPTDRSYRDFFHNAPIGIFITTPGGRFLDANPDLARMLGYKTPEELMDSVTDIGAQLYADPEVRNRVKHLLLKHGEVLNFECRIVRRDGTVFWVSYCVRAVRDDEGRILHFQGFLIDISERKRAEEALSESENRYRHITENMRDIVTETDAGGIILYTSPSHRTLLGDSPEEVIGRSSFDRIHPEDRGRVAAEYMDGIRTKRDRDAEYRYRHADGHYVWLRSSGRTFYDASGNLTGIIINSHDITERKRAEEELRESEERYRSIYENAIEGIYQSTPEGRYISVNPAMARLCGYASPEEMVATVTDIETQYYADSEDRRRYKRLLDEQGKIDHFEYPVRRKDGSTLWVSANARTVCNANGDIVHYEGRVQDITERKQMETERAFRNALLSAQQEASIDGILAVDSKGKIILHNKRFTEIWKVPPDVVATQSDELLLQSVRQWLVDPEAFLEKVKYLYDHQQESSRDEIPLNDGRIIERYSSPLMGADNQYFGRVWFFRDITERKRAEQELRESERQLATLMSNLPGMAYRCQNDPNWTMVFISDGAQALTGYPAADLLENRTVSYSDLVHPEDREAIWSHVQSSLERRQPFVLNYRLQRATGEERWVWEQGRGVFDAQDRLLYLEGLVLDVTDRKQAEEALRESETRYSTFISSTSDFVFLKDDRFRHIVANKALADFYGRPPEEVIGLSDFDLMPEEAARSCRASDREAVIMGSVVSTEEAVGERVFETTKFHVPLQSGKTGVGGFIRDITERKRAVEERRELEEQLRRAEKMEALGLLAGGVAHDLNNILGVMVGYSELLAEKLPEGSPTRRHADNILQASIRGAAIIQDLLTLARRGVSVSDVVDLGGIISDYLGTQEFKELRDHHPQVAFTAELTDGLLNIKGSPIHLVKTVMNLVSNAFESIAGRGKVALRTENRYLDQPIRGYDDVQEGDYVVLTVSDTGGGISAEDLGKIFEPFYTKKVMGRSGTGLGLAVVWGTVKDHSGYIDVQSTEGEGSTFTLYFPVTREKSDRDDSAVSPVSCQGGGESILVVDDVKEQRELAISMLERLGYQVEAVTGGEAAVAFLRSRKVDLVVLDMIMDPGIDGMETYRRILEIHPRQKAILASGYSETDRVRQTLEMGAGAFVQKPYILEKIGLAVRTELDRK